MTFDNIKNSFLDFCRVTLLLSLTSMQSSERSSSIWKISVFNRLSSFHPRNIVFQIFHHIFSNEEKRSWWEIQTKQQTGARAFACRSSVPKRKHKLWWGRNKRMVQVDSLIFSSLNNAAMCHWKIQCIFFLANSKKQYRSKCTKYIPDLFRFGKI